MRTKTEQEAFWEGDFGTAYTQRNVTAVQHRRGFFERVLRTASGVRSACELGANRGDNLAALRSIDEAMSLTGVELNPAAVELMAKIPGVEAVRSSIQDFAPSRTFDLVFTCGVLIHIAPSDLPLVYDRMFALSNRYVMVNEYFNPTPVEIGYRGHGDRLFKRDFGGEIMDRFGAKLRVVDYGFLWKRVEPGWDDTTWVIFEKVS